jgi:hypothetical protein
LRTRSPTGAVSALKVGCERSAPLPPRPHPKRASKRARSGSGDAAGSAGMRHSGRSPFDQSRRKPPGFLRALSAPDFARHARSNPSSHLGKYWQHLSSSGLIRFRHDQASWIRRLLLPQLPHLRLHHLSPLPRRKTSRLRKPARKPRLLPSVSRAGIATIAPACFVNGGKKKGSNHRAMGAVPANHRTGNRKRTASNPGLRTPRQLPFLKKSQRCGPNKQR